MPNKLILVLALAVAMVGCPKGTTTHKVTAAQHSFKAVVQGFQDVEIAEHDKGAVPDDLHIQIQQGIQKVAQGGVDLDTALASGATAVTLKGKLTAIYVVLDEINTQGLIGIRNPATKATLEIALDQVKAIIDSALIQVQ